MKAAIGSNVVNVVFGSPITALAAGIFSLVVGCGNDVQSLTQDFSKHKDRLNELKVVMLSLKKSSGITGYVTQMGDKKDFLVSGGNTVPVNSLSSENVSKAGRLKEIVHEIKVSNVHVLDRDALWVVMASGGVLGTDAGYTSYDSSPPFPSGDKAKYFPIPGEAGWYVFVR